MFGHVYDYGKDAESQSKDSHHQTNTSNAGHQQTGSDTRSGSKGSKVSQHNESQRTRNSTRAATPGDDLKKIKGIGPAISKQLADLGYVSYEQIAELDNKTIATLQEKLKHEQDIHKQDWVGQAKKLVKQRNSSK